YRNFIDNPNLSPKFVDYVLAEIGDIYQEEYFESTLDSLQRLIEPEMKPLYSVLKQDPDWMYSIWVEQTQFIKDWVRNRLPNLCSQLAKEYGFGNDYELKIYSGNDTLLMNGIRLNREVFSGHYFENRALTIESISSQGFVVECLSDSAGVVKRTKYTVAGSSVNIEVPENTFRASVYTAESYLGIEDVTVESKVKVIAENGVIIISGNDENEEVRIFNAAGMQVYRGYDSSVGALAKGVYLVKLGATVYKVAL
ncbi:MAG: hypothetical protein K2J74_00110, partial [Muribaculaceae bacterium]|nr:hypothetical protein [Muribaculaceae bacterium]